jgi:predicted AAA+ superfamily ATPase
MIERRVASRVTTALGRQPAVALTGPRQCGKTTLAFELARGRPATYLDLELAEDRERLAEPGPFFADHENELVVIDEVQRMPRLFEELRGVIDRGRREGRATGRFLLLGSASIELITKSETLAGRIAYVDLAPFDVTEVVPQPGPPPNALDRPRPAPELDHLWVRGGFPRSFLAEREADSVAWRDDFVRSCLDRYLPQLGPRLPAATLERLWAMLAHSQGGLLNTSQLAGSLGIDGRTVNRYIDALVDLLLVRRLTPRGANVRKRLTRSPKVYVRDSGLVHSLLRIEDKEALVRHPIAGPSWEGMVIENLLAVADRRAIPGFYRTAVGAEIDLVLDWPDETWAIEVKRSLNPAPERGFYSAIEDVRPNRSFVVYPGVERFRIAPNIEAISLPDLCDELIAQAR